MENYRFFLTSSLEKVFPDRMPEAMDPALPLTVFRGSRGAVQLVYYGDLMGEDPFRATFALEVTGGPCRAVLRKVELIPSDFPAYAEADEYYITTKPGLFPDLLVPMEQPKIRVLHDQYRSIWIHFDVPETAAAGDYPVTITMQGTSEVYHCGFTLRVPEARLPKQTLIHTNWFHADCLAQYYHVEPFSEAHWRIVENFIRFAVRDCGVNMLLTPVLTPPLDTAPDGERMTTQLVDIRVDQGVYSFGFERLTRWVEICKNAGIEYLEIAHLFTQWGACNTPKVIAVVDGAAQRIGGNHIRATSPEYGKFLTALIPALREKLEELGYDRDHVYFHISDEPAVSQMESYRAARDQVAKALEGCPVMDALSDMEFYRSGLIEQPVAAVDHIQSFLDAEVPDLWAYYCCAQKVDVPNRFFAMESARNRIMGVLLYRHNIKGFLHWGYNFYNSQYSIHPIDPYRMTHAEYAFPSGDAFLVYPGADGAPLASIRGEVQMEGFVDLRALRLLEARQERDTAEALLREDWGEKPMTFTDYPRDKNWLLRLRERLGAALG